MKRAQKKMIFPKPIYFFLLLFCAIGVSAQENASINATIDKNKILIGEPAILKVDVTIPSNASYSFGIDSIDYFEILERKIDTIRNDGNIIFKGEYKITSFDSGHHVIPSFSLTSKIKSDTLPMDVVFSDFDPSQDYHDIKDVIDVKEKQKKEWWYVAAGALLLIALLIWALLRKRKPLVVVKSEVKIDPYQEAMARLIKLESGTHPAKEFYSELADIFRLYVFRKKNILSLQKTTDDLVVQLKTLNLDKEVFDKLSQSLRLSDFVKFAKYIPAEEDNRSTLNVVKGSIEEIERNAV
ncbi:MAG TPA: hypothetical protein PKC72_03840 [Chitinophagaceae bacterium]|nr:hypothetical protein [Chitinophagaceae bacterium]